MSFLSCHSSYIKYCRNITCDYQSLLLFMGHKVLSSGLQVLPSNFLGFTFQSASVSFSLIWQSGINRHKCGGYNGDQPTSAFLWILNLFNLFLKFMYHLYFYLDQQFSNCEWRLGRAQSPARVGMMSLNVRFCLF